MADTVLIVTLPLFAYVLGSVPFGLLFTRWSAGVDIRNHGSGNIGFTNVRRSAGTVPGLLTLACDVLKGALPVGLAAGLATGDTAAWNLYAGFVAVAAVGGHLRPLYFGFKSGGKGVATALGCFLVLSPVAAFLSLLVFIMLVCWWGWVSVASMGAACLLPVFVWLVSGSAGTTAVALFIAVAVVWRHRENISRLMAGAEPRI